MASHPARASTCPFLASHRESPPSAGARIRQARQLRDLTIKQLAQESGVSEKTLGRIERDEVASRSTARVLNYLGLSLDPLLSEADFPETLWHLYELWRDQVAHDRPRGS